jgi:hypothetical protein
MTKREQYIKQLRPVLESDAGAAELEAFLVSNSNLPGPRGNLELALTLADCFETLEVGDCHVESLWRWGGIGPEEAGTNSPRSFLPFCAVVSLGARYLRVPDAERERSLDVIRAAASDPRWRIREAAAFAFQRIAEKDFGIVRDLFSSWLETASLVEMRAMEASLAHPPILGDPDTVDFCFQVTDAILHHVESLAIDDRKTEEFRILRKGLEYAISVFAASSPEQGFPFLRKWASSDDTGVVAIIGSNLAKSRLAKHYPEEILEIRSVMWGGGL